LIRSNLSEQSDNIGNSLFCDLKVSCRVGCEVSGYTTFDESSSNYVVFS
jgi:hypothetical protein